MKYFAYGSNMSLARLQERVPSAVRHGVFTLVGHQLRFHMESDDGSGKCDAYQTNNEEDVVIGALFDMHEDDKVYLDRAESLGSGYDAKTVIVRNNLGETFEALIYFAIKINSSLKPYGWYLNHVVIGAIEMNLPAQYTDIIQATKSIEDLDTNRDAKQRSIYPNHSRMTFQS